MSRLDSFIDPSDDFDIVEGMGEKTPERRPDLDKALDPMKATEWELREEFEQIF